MLEMFRQPYLSEDDGFDIGGGIQEESLDDFLEETAVEEAKTETTETATETKPTETVSDALNYDKFLDELGTKIKINHQNERPGSVEDIVTNYQKGRNYDKLQERLNQIQSDPRLGKYDKVQQLAELYGMSDEDMLDALYNQYYESAAEKQGLTAEQIRKDHELTQKERMIQQKEQAQSKAEADKAMYTNFLKVFPNVKPEEIKAETWQLVNQGMDLTAAYIHQRNHELESKLKVMEQNLQNVKKAPVAGITTHGGGETAHKDAFLEGFEED
jgi:hypothetical protein